MQTATSQPTPAAKRQPYILPLQLRGLGTAVLAGVLLAWAAASPASGDPPPEQSPGEQRVAELLTRVLPGMKSAPKAEGDAKEPDNPPATEPLDSCSVTLTDHGLLEVHVRDTEITTVHEMIS